MQTLVSCPPTQPQPGELACETVAAHTLASTLGPATLQSSTEVHPGTQPGQMAHLAYPRTTSHACLPALKPSSLANKVRKLFRGAGGGDAAWAISSVLVLLGSEEKAAKQESGGEAAPGSPEAELETPGRKPTPREASVNSTEDRLLAELPTQ